MPGRVTVKKFNRVWLDGTCASDCDRVACENIMSLLQKNLTEPDFQKGIFKYVPSETSHRIITELYRNRGIKFVVISQLQEVSKYSVSWIFLGIFANSCHWVSHYKSSHVPLFQGSRARRAFSSLKKQEAQKLKCVATKAARTWETNISNEK